MKPLVDPTRRLVEEASRGEPLAVARLLEQHLPALRAFVRLRAGPRLRAMESCSDIVQSACREVLQRLDRFRYRSEKGFRQWLYLTTLRKIVDHDRFFAAGKRGAAAPRDAPPPRSDEQVLRCYSLLTPSRIAMAREDARRLEDAFDRLPDAYKEAIVLHRLVGLSHAEIGRRLGRTEEAAKILLSRATARLVLLISGSGD